MTPGELLERIRDVIKTFAWNGTANLIFSEGVYVVSEIPIQQISQYQKPFAFILDQGDRSDPEYPGLIYQDFAVLDFVENVGNNYGEGPMLGSNRVANTSQGAGAKDIEQEIVEQLTRITVVGGEKIVITPKSRVRPQHVTRNSPTIFKQMVFTSSLTTYYF